MQGTIVIAAKACDIDHTSGALRMQLRSVVSRVKKRLPYSNSIKAVSANSKIHLYID